VGALGLGGSVVSEKPNCYLCVHRGQVPNSAHSSCQHPATAEEHGGELSALIRTLGKRTGIARMQSAAAEQLGVVGAERGVRRGWFLFPINFDPVWLESCNGFEAGPTQGETLGA